MSKNNLPRDINELLKSLLNHKISIAFIPRNDNVKDMLGILKDFNENIIWLESVEAYGCKTQYYLNRHSCILLSIIDEGVVNEK